MKRTPGVFLFIGLLFLLTACGYLTSVKQPVTTDTEPPPTQSRGGGAQTAYDVAYADKSAAQKLDIYLPDGQGPHPVIVWIHGGAWEAGDKRLEPLTPQMQVLKRGYALVSINYRLSGEAAYPAQIEDVKTAVEWIRKYDDKYDFDAAHIGAWGGSAGGHLASLIGTAGEGTNKVQAVVDWYGPCDLTAADMISRDINHVLDKMLGGPVAESLETARAASPVTYIDAKDPPFLIQHGVNDPIVPLSQAQELSDKLVPAIGQDKVTLDILPGGHGGPAFNMEQNVDKILDFFDKYLRI